MLRMGQSVRELDRICGSGSVKASLPEVLQHVHAIADIQLAREGPIAVRIGVETVRSSGCNPYGALPVLPMSLC